MPTSFETCATWRSWRQSCCSPSSSRPSCCPDRPADGKFLAVQAQPKNGGVPAVFALWHFVCRLSASYFLLVLLARTAPEMAYQLSPRLPLLRSHTCANSLG